MVDEQISVKQGVCLVGGGHLCPEVLAKALKFAPVIVAADGGADAVLATGRRPEAIIGDLDSVTVAAREALLDAHIVHVAEQESTDFEKCLRRIDAPFIIAVGFTGGRLDHTLAAMSVLARRLGPPTVVLDKTDAAFAAPQRLALDLKPDTRVSLFPMAAAAGASEGLEWPIDGLQFEPSRRVGTSNKATGPVHLTFENDGMLVLLPESCLSEIIPAIAD